jgi:hypothetical protein
MTKEEIQEQWKPGDDSEAARIVKKNHAIEVSRWALAAWRKRRKNQSPLTPIYLAAFKEAIKNRKKK